MIDDPASSRAGPRGAPRPVDRMGYLDFDQLDEVDLLDAAEGLTDLVEDRARQAGSVGRARGGILLALLRPWFDPRPGELRGLILILCGGLVLTTALWFDASRRPSELAPPDLVAVTSVGGDDPWTVPGAGSAAPLPVGEVVVHVSGAVRAPGVVTLPVGARVADAVDAAGGAEGDALLERLNLARPLDDGEQVHVPRVGEDVAPPSGTTSRGVLADGRIDINRASAEELATLPGIGPARAQAIITAREERAFTAPGDLRRVPGIGEVTFQRLAPLIAVV